jgi:hypothetical protein
LEEVHRLREGLASTVTVTEISTTLAVVTATSTTVSMNIDKRKMQDASPLEVQVGEGTPAALLDPV